MKLREKQLLEQNLLKRRVTEDGDCNGMDWGESAMILPILYSVAQTIKRNGTASIIGNLSNRKDIMRERLGT